MSRVRNLGLRLVQMLCVFGICLPAPAVAAGSASILNDIDIVRPPGRMVDVGGYRLHIYCLGKGSPTVVFDSGLGGSSLDWAYVQDRLRDEVRVCTYDRAGYGWSEPGPAPRVTEQISDELSSLLEGADIGPPYILVGHSFGGFNMEYYAKHYPQQVAGLVLVDASHPEQSRRLPGLPARGRQRDPSSMVTFFNPEVVRRFYPREVWFPVAALMSSRKALLTQRRELSNFNVSAAQVVYAGPLPNVPLVVVTRGRRVWPHSPLGDALEKTWSDLQRELAASITGGRQIIAHHSGHLIHLEEPDVVAGAVRAILRRPCITSMAQHLVPEPRLAC